MHTQLRRARSHSLGLRRKSPTVLGPGFGARAENRLVASLQELQEGLQQVRGGETTPAHLSP